MEGGQGVNFLCFCLEVVYFLTIPNCYHLFKILHGMGSCFLWTDCANNGLFVSVRFVRVGCRQDEAVFELKEAGFKLDVTRWVPRLTQSVMEIATHSLFTSHDLK